MPKPEPTTTDSATPARRTITGPRWMAAAFLLVLAALGVLLYAARAQYPGPSSGEFWSDANIINASRGFDDAGFTTTWGLPRIQTAAPVDDASALYVSYPPGPYWLSYAAWTVGKALGVEPLLAARLFAQTCGLASALLAWLVFTRLSHSRAIGALAGLFYVLSPAFLSYSAALHHMAYSPMLLFGAMRAWLAFEDTLGPRRLVWLALTALLFAADCWTNLEHMFFFALFVGVRTAFHFRWPVVLGAALVGPLPIPMMALRVLHNAQVLGGWDAALEQFRSKASRRSGSGRAGVDLHELASSWLARLGWPWPTRDDTNLVWNQEFVYPALDPWVLGALAAILISVALHGAARWCANRSARRPLSVSLVDPRKGLVGVAPPEPPPKAGARFLFWSLPPGGPIACGLGGGVLLLAGGLTWFVVMTQHTQPHRFIVLLLMPGIALLLGTAAWWVVESARRVGTGSDGLLAALLRGRAWILAALLLALFARQIVVADALNQLWPLDERAHRRTASRQDANARSAIVGEALAARGVSRLHVYDGANVMPWRAASLAQPFVYARIEMPEALAPSEAIYAEAWDATEVAACLDAAERFGLPLLAGPPSQRAFVFMGGDPSSRERRVDAPLDRPAPGESGTGSLKAVRAVAWCPTLTGEEWVLAIFLEGDLAGTPEDPVLSRYTFTLRADAREGTGSDNGPRLESRTRLNWSPIRDDRRALVLLSVPTENLEPGAPAELAIWDRRARAAVTLDPAAGSPPDPGVTPLAGGRWLRIAPPQTESQSANP
ncbi:MAG: hypothetical protein R3B68_01150 [Phycisphaerales bacterium]